MQTDSDRLLKKVWLVNGFILLALGVFALFGAVVIVAEPLLSRRGEPAVRVSPASPEGAAPRAVRFTAPTRVRGTATQIVTVHHGKADQPREAYNMGASSGSHGIYDRYGADGPLVNVVFLAPGAREGRLLLDRPAYITELRYPRPRDAGEPPIALGISAAEDSLQTWISYEIVDRDTDGDKKLSVEDGAGLFVSALDGSALRRVIPENFTVISHAAAPDGRGIVVLALEPAKGKSIPDEQMRQRSFLYDVASGRLVAYTALNTAADRAAKIVGR